MKIRDFHLRIFRNILNSVALYDSTVEFLLVERKFLMKISEQSATSSHSEERPLPQALRGNVSEKETLTLPAIVAGRFAKFDIGLRARLLGRLLASVGPLALKVVGGGVFSNY